MDVISKKYKRKDSYKLGVEFHPDVETLFEKALITHNQNNPLNQLNKSSFVRGKVSEFIETTLGKVTKS